MNPAANVPPITIMKLGALINARGSPPERNTAPPTSPNPNSKPIIVGIDI
jgi:hypothetical protein